MNDYGFLGGGIPPQMLQQLGLMNSAPATQAGAGEQGATDATGNLLTQMALGSQSRALSPQMLMYMARLRGQQQMPMGGRQQGLPQGAYPGGNLLQPGAYPGSSQAQQGGQFGAMG